MCGPCGLTEICIDCIHNPNKEEMMKNIKVKKCKNCKGMGMVSMGEGIKGLMQCPVCYGSGYIKDEAAK